MGFLVSDTRPGEIRRVLSEARRVPLRGTTAMAS
jgi:hypothetical protein